MNKYILFFGLFFFHSFYVFPQMQGLVLSNEGNPLNNVDIFLVEQNLLLQTNSEGVFLIEEMIPNNSYLEFYKSGYGSEVIQYKNGEEIKVVLKKLHVELDEIGIRESVSVLGNNKVVNIEKKSLKNKFMSSTS